MTKLWHIGLAEENGPGRFQPPDVGDSFIGHKVAQRPAAKRVANSRAKIEQILDQDRYAVQRT